MKLEVRDGAIGYADAGILQKNISFTSEGNQITAVLGPNGAGKSSLLRCLLCLQPWKGGEAFLDGINMKELTPSRLWRRIAYVPQNVSRTGLTVLEMVLLGRSRERGFLAQPSKADYEAAEAAMERLGILALKYRACDTLSGGELRLAAIARALTSDPKLFIMDEPQSGLDIKNRFELLSLLRRLSVQDGRQIIFVTHEPQSAYEAADRVLLLSRSGSPLWGEPADILTRKQLMKAFDMKPEMWPGEGCPGIFG